MASRVLTRSFDVLRSVVARFHADPLRDQFAVNSLGVQYELCQVGSAIHIASIRSTIYGVSLGRQGFSTKNENSKENSSRKAPRLREAKTSLGRVAVDARRSRGQRKGVLQEQEISTKTVIAYSSADRYDIPQAAQILRHARYSLDPYSTGLYPQVIHVQVPFLHLDHKDNSLPAGEVGDLFIFPSGIVVAWAVDDLLVRRLIHTTLLPAAQNPHIGELETENLEFHEDKTCGTSAVHGDTIRLGTKFAANEDNEICDRYSGSLGSPGHSALVMDVNYPHESNIVLAKTAFSSGLARSVKLAVLETSLNNYFDSTQHIPQLLSQGSKLPFSRSFILRKTGQLLNIRAQLNFVSELTDSIPDLFWDSRTELGLETYFDQVSQALDVRIRIKILNERMDYASEVAGILRERLSEKHGFLLEWLIIFLISVEVCFAIRQIWVEHGMKSDPDGIEALLRIYLQRQLEEAGERE